MFSVICIAGNRPGVAVIKPGGNRYSGTGIIPILSKRARARTQVDVVCVKGRVPPCHRLLQEVTRYRPRNTNGLGNQIAAVPR